MKKLKDIKIMIQIAQQRWSEIEEEISDGPLFPRESVNVKMEKLKNLLEDIRADIEASLVYTHCTIFVKVCRSFLETLFLISEKLRLSYVFPGYVESYYILDTMRFTNNPAES